MAEERRKGARKLLVVVSGSVGTGKSSVAGELAKILSLRHVNVGELVVGNKKALSAGYDRKRKSVIADLGKVTGFLSKKGFLGKGNVVEGHYSQDLAKNPDFVFVLRCDPKELDLRLLKRKYSEEKRAENILAEILDSSTIECERAYPNERIFEIDTTKKSPADVAATIGRIISGKIPRKRRFDYSSKYL